MNPSYSSFSLKVRMLRVFRPSRWCAQDVWFMSGFFARKDEELAQWSLELILSCLLPRLSSDVVSAAPAIGLAPQPPSFDDVNCVIAAASAKSWLCSVAVVQWSGIECTDKKNNTYYEEIPIYVIYVSIYIYICRSKLPNSLVDAISMLSNPERPEQHEPSQDPKGCKV